MAYAIYFLVMVVSFFMTVSFSSEKIAVVLFSIIGIYAGVQGIRSINKIQKQQKEYANMNPKDLIDDLNSFIGHPNPRNLIEKWWQAKHYPHDTERINFIIDYIEKLTVANDRALNLKANLAVNEDVLQMMIKGAYVKAERQAELQLQQHTNELQKIEDEKKGRSLDLQAKEIQNLKSMAEVNMTNSRTEQEKAKADLMRKAVDNLDSLPEALKVYVMRAVFNPADKQEDDILLQEQVRDYLRMEKEAAAKKADYEAERMKDDNEFRRWKNEKTKNDIG